MAKFKNMEDVAKFLIEDYRFRNLLSSIWRNDYGEKEVKDAAVEAAETWGYLVDKHSAQWRNYKGGDEVLRLALSDWFANQLMYDKESDEDKDAEPAYVVQKRIEYTAAKMVYDLYKVVGA